MYCPFCNSPNTKVTNSRLTKNNSQVWRRRKCLRCHEPFTSHELIDLSHLMVKKKSGKIQKYSRMKLYAGIYGATISSKTPNREYIVDKITREAEQQILALKKKQISSVEIANIVMGILKHVHPRTFLRMLAYHADIRTEADMVREFNRYSRYRNGFIDLQEDLHT